MDFLPMKALSCLLGLLLAVQPLGLPAQTVDRERATVGEFNLSPATGAYQVWGAGSQRRAYADELLPACFERTLELREFKTAKPLSWIFTGPRAGITIGVLANAITLSHRYYDSPGFTEVSGKPERHPEWNGAEINFVVQDGVKSVTLRLDGRMGLVLLANGTEIHRREWPHDLSRHQLLAGGGKDTAKGRWLSPTPATAAVSVRQDMKHQTIIGFGGTTIPTAYQQLSPDGKRRWWQLLAEYNLLIQREYPIGTRLNRAMDNWDLLADATPHYYGDNFPNGEICDFAYNRRIREIGGQVWFEFWALPPWVGKDADRYAAAMLAYCRAANTKAGAPPEIVGIQNEVRQTPGQWRAMTLALRRELDAAGFNRVRIHHADATDLNHNLEYLKAFRSMPEVWSKIDFSAGHVYDYQKFFTNPDAYDPLLREWRALAGDKPVLSNEICVNDSRYQLDSYRLALAMGQLYHKNLTVADASALCYCWLLLNVTQPSYGATRSLFVPDDGNGGMPAASSHQLRVFGAFSRCIQRGMTRVETACADPDLLISAFAGENGRATLVALNRGTRAVTLDVAWRGVLFTHFETASPYHPNIVSAGDTGTPPVVEPGTILTLTNLPLGPR